MLFVTSDFSSPLDLEQALQRWAFAQRPSNTSRAYSTYARQYFDFCREKGLQPSSHVSLAAFMFVGLTERHLGRNTLISAIPSAVSDIFRFDDVSPTLHPLVREMKTAIRRLTAPTASKLPVTRGMLVRMVATARAQEEDTRDIFMMILMYLAFLRESEVVRLRFNDVWVEKVDGATCLFIYVETRKNDQFRYGHTVVLEECATSPICPVAWFRLHCAFRKSPTVVFHRVRGIRPLGVTKPNEVLKARLRSIGVDPEPYGSHSLRRGGASAAAAARIAAHVIARHGGWRSDAVFTYITDGLERKLSVSRALLR